MPKVPLRHVLLGLAVATAFALSPARADWRILYYDNGGQLLGVQGGNGTAGNKDEAGNGAAGAGGGQVTVVDPRTLPPEMRFEPGEVLVADPPSGFDRTVRQLGFAIIDRATLQALSVDVYRLRVPNGTTVPAAVSRLRRQFPGVGVDANHLLDPTADGPTPDLYARAVMGWGAPSAACGRGIRIGDIDGAVDTQHPALAGRLITYKSFNSNGRPPAAEDHGTAIASMMIGRAPWGGLLPAAELYHANIFELSSAGRVTANVFALIKSVDWLASKRVHVINMSVAGSANQVLDQILSKARARGFIMVAAAGNGGPDAPPAYPAAYDYVIAVTAVDVRRQIYAHSNRGPYIDFAAPGVRMFTAVPGGGRVQSGTSFAAPYVSVLVALDVARGRAHNPDQARQDLRPNLVDLGPPGKDDEFGWGLVTQPRDCRPSSAG